MTPAYQSCKWPWQGHSSGFPLYRVPRMRTNIILINFLSYLSIFKGFWSPKALILNMTRKIFLNFLREVPNCLSSLLKLIPFKVSIPSCCSLFTGCDLIELGMLCPGSFPLHWSLHPYRQHGSALALFSSLALLACWLWWLHTWSWVFHICSHIWHINLICLQHQMVLWQIANTYFKFNQKFNVNYRDLVQ